MTKNIKIDIVSDVVCPWCIIGYRRLENAISDMGIQNRVEVEWHPFELNPYMTAEGEEIVGHMSNKYGMTREESLRTLANMAELSAEIGFRFDFFDRMKMVNTLDAHILLEWAKTWDMQTQLKLRLFMAFFSERKDVSDRQVLARELQGLGLDVEAALAVLDDDRAGEGIKKQEAYWHGLGVSSVPTMVLNQSIALRGAQPVDTYKQILEDLIDNRAKVLM